MHWRMPRAVVAMKDWTSVDYGGSAPSGPATGAATGGAAVVYMPTSTPKPTTYPVTRNYLPSYPQAPQQALPSVKINVSQVEGPRPSSIQLPPSDQVALETRGYGVRSSFKLRTLPTVAYAPRPETAPRPEPPKVSMDQATSLVSQFVNNVSATHGEKYPLNIRAANELLDQVRQIDRAVSTPGYTVQESKGRYVVVPTSAEASVPVPESGPAWRGSSYGRTEGTSIAVGVEPSKLPNLQRQLLGKALQLAAQLTGHPAPRLPEIKAPSYIARNQ